MKILMLTPYLPYPPASGGQIRTLNLLKYLSSKNKVTLVSLYKNTAEKKYSTYLTSFCDKVYACKRAEKPWQINILLKAIFTLSPLLIVRNFSQEATTLLQELIKKEKYDVIHAETFYIMPHIPKTNIPILLVEQTIEYQVYQHFVSNLPWFTRPLFLVDIIKLKFWERFYWKKADIVATVSEADQKLIKKIEPKINPVIIPNCAGDEMVADRLEPKKIDSPILLFQGNFFWLQNLEAAEYLITRLAPLLAKKIPHCQIIIAGQKTERIKNKGINLKLVEVKPDKTGVVKKLYQEATLFIAPIYGPGGTRLKILAAMASGLPVISTQTGVEGLAVEDNKHVLIADSPKEFIEKIKKILDDKKLYEKVRSNAFLLVKEKYSWKSITKLLEAVYQKISKK